MQVYEVPAGSGPHDVAPAADGGVWFTAQRAGSLGYITYAKRLDSRAIEALRGVRVLVLNALWRGNPHPTHFSVEEAVDAARTVGAEQTFLTHLAHRARHADLAASLPAGISPAHDGLVVDVPEA